MTEPTDIHIVLSEQQLAAFASLLQCGVRVRAQVGCHVLNLLSDQLGIDKDYVEGRITTLFVDAKAIDGLETTYIRDGSVLALSAAMPGLVGATMRRGGHLAVMRENMTYQAQDLAQAGTGWVSIKLFNMVLLELGALILQRGIWLRGEELSAFLKERSEPFWLSVCEVNWDGRQIEPSALKENAQGLDPHADVRLRVEFKG